MHALKASEKTIIINHTNCSRSVCNNSVTNVEIPGQMQFDASKAFFNSSSHTTCSRTVKMNHYRWKHYPSRSTKYSEPQCYCQLYFSYPILPSPALSCPLPSFPTFSCPILHSPVLSYNLLSSPVLSSLVTSCSYLPL